jgi:hypothetical protein
MVIEKLYIAYENFNGKEGNIRVQEAREIQTVYESNRGCIRGAQLN